MIKQSTLMNLVELGLWIVLLTVLGVTWAKADDWGDLVQGLSTKGIRVEKNCYADEGTCTLFMRFKAPDGTTAMLAEVEGSGGKTISRHICNFPSDDRRVCINWDTQERREQIYDRGKQRWAPAR